MDGIDGHKCVTFKKFAEMAKEEIKAAEPESTVP